MQSMCTKLFSNCTNFEMMCRNKYRNHLLYAAISITLSYKYGQNATRLLS